MCHKRKLSNWNIGCRSDEMTLAAQTFAPDLFRGQTVLVTGGTSGIGLACAQAFRDLGASTVAAGVTEAERSRASGEQGNSGISFRVVDVRDAVAVDDLI